MLALDMMKRERCHATRHALRYAIRHLRLLMLMPWRRLMMRLRARRATMPRHTLRLFRADI